MQMDVREGTIYRLAWPVAILVIAFLLIGSSGCYEVVEPVCGTLDAAALDSFRVESDGGSVEVQRVAGATEVVLDGEIHITAATVKTAEVRADRITLDFHADGTEAVVALDIPLDAQPAWGDLLLKVPDGFGGAVRTVNGGVVAEGLDDDLVVDTTNGAVEVRGVLGTVDLHSTNGEVVVAGGEGDVRVRTTNARVTVSDRPGDVDAHSTNGRIEVFDVTGAVEAETTNGRIVAEGHVGVLDVSTTNGEIDLDTELTPGGSLLAATTNGRIGVTLPLDVSAELRAETTNGDIDIEDLVYAGEVEDDWAEVVFGDGDGLIDLATTHGHIDVGGR